MPLDPTPDFLDGHVSFWYREVGLAARRPALPGDIQVDVAIVGGGLTGLWTAHYLKTHQPDLRIAILEKEFAGYGASGRNGGWLSAELPGQARRYAQTHGVDAVVRMQRAMFAAVDLVIDVAAADGIDADIVKGGLLHVATNPAQLTRLAERVPELRRYGWGEGDAALLDAAALRERVNIANGLGAVWSPHCARIQPAKLVRGLADRVERTGVVIYEDTEVARVDPGAAVTRRGTVKADIVIRALEGFTASLEDHRRSWLPMNSSMVVTEPLPPQVWAEIGWDGAELIGDEAHGFVYLQRTADGRIALGGRGIPYRFGSRWDSGGQTRHATLDQLRSVLGRHFPMVQPFGIDHTWSGVLGVSRDWCASVGFDARTGLGWAGGYVGHGVTATNLAGRTLADLVLSRDSELVSLPWVGRRVRQWEPEPARWIGVRGLYLAYRAADRRESRNGATTTSIVAKLADRISGR